MDLRDITNESSLLKSYKTVFVDNQKYELVKLYRDKREFPIFTDRVFKLSTVAPYALLAYKYREKLNEDDVGRIFVLERIDRSGDDTKTRLFFVWISPKLAAQFKKSIDSYAVNASVIFHPFPRKYPSYWQGDIEPAKAPNYLELGVRYICKEKYTVLQHWCAVRPAKSAGQGEGLENKESGLELMVVVPVSSPASYSNLTSPAELEDALREIARRCYEGVMGKPMPSAAPAIGRVAVSGYSRSGIQLRGLLDKAKDNEPFMRSKLKEIYAFDVMLDEIDEKTKVVLKSKVQGYNELWSRLKAWQGDDADKKIRLYSAEPQTVAAVRTELEENLKRFSGGYNSGNVLFSKFNGEIREGSSKFSGLSDGVEIYSTDNSRSLVVLPSNNFLVYLSDENLKNSNGFEPGGGYERGLEGHSWFISRLISHALYHSGFWPK